MIGGLRPFSVLPSADDVQAFEAEFGFDLPSDYKAFLLGYNGGRIENPNADDGDDLSILGFYARPLPRPLPAPAARQGGPVRDDFWGVALFHGLLRRANQYGDLRDIYLVMRDEWEHPPELLPIASMPGNGKYFLCVAGAYRGHVLVAGDAYLDKRDAGRAPTPDDYHRVAASFQGLLDYLEWRQA